MAERPARRAFQVYIYVVCLITILLVMFSAATAVYSIVRIAAPGTTSNSDIDFFDEGPAVRGSANDAERDAGIAGLIENGIFALVAGGVFWWHWREGEKVRAELRAESAGPASGPPPRRKAAPRRRAAPASDA